jgi:hypothetical protein
MVGPKKQGRSQGCYTDASAWQCGKNPAQAGLFCTVVRASGPVPMVRLIRPCHLVWGVDDIGEPSGGHPREGYCTDARRPVATESPAAVNAITGLVLRVSIK